MDSRQLGLIESPIIIALDYADQQQALTLVDQLDPARCRLKIGKEMFTRYGVTLINCLQARNFDIFLDLKFHDIPNTVARAVQAAAELGVWMLNVHASGGERMMVAARESLNAFGKDAPLLIAVTVLTSMDDSDLRAIGIMRTAAQQTACLAALSVKSGMDGVVCSAHEVAALKAQYGVDFKLVTPGIRPEGSEMGDQRRVMTPLQAQQVGVDYMVIGRPITQAADPAAALQAILNSLSAPKFL